MSWESLRSDRLEQIGSCCLRADAKFLLEDTHALLILAERGGGLARPCVETHQLALCRLVQRVERQLAQRELDCHAVLLTLFVPGDECLQRLDQMLTERLALVELPLVEGWTVWQGKTRQEVVTIESDGGPEADDTGRQWGVWRVGMPCALVGGSGESLRIQR